jgi:hypothetical protein
VILISWGIAFFEYVLQVPANRIGHEHFSAAELKTIQEVITLSVFADLLRPLPERAAVLEPPDRLRLHRRRRLLHLSQMGLRSGFPRKARPPVDKPAARRQVALSGCKSPRFP